MRIVKLRHRNYLLCNTVGMIETLITSLNVVCFAINLFDLGKYLKASATDIN